MCIIGVITCQPRYYQQGLKITTLPSKRPDGVADMWVTHCDNIVCHNVTHIGIISLRTPLTFTAGTETIPSAIPMIIGCRQHLLSM
jgi:hypothetical protein